MWVNGNEVSLAWVDNSYGGSGLDGGGMVGRVIHSHHSLLYSLGLSLSLPESYLFFIIIIFFFYSELG